MPFVGSSASFVLPGSCPAYCTCIAALTLCRAILSEPGGSPWVQKFSSKEATILNLRPAAVRRTFLCEGIICKNLIDIYIIALILLLI